VIDLRVTTLEHIARGDSLDRVMEHLCRAFETNFPHVICSVLSVDRGGMMHPLAAPSLPMTYSAALDNIAIGPNIGSCGTAAYIRAPVEVHDIATDPLGQLQGCGAAAGPAHAGPRLFWIPGLVLATFALYFRECRGPSPEERRLVDICIHLCDLAMARHLRIAERERSANMDALTDLPNRRGFDQTLAHLDCDTPGAWAIMIIDLDNLKPPMTHSAMAQVILCCRNAQHGWPDWPRRTECFGLAVMVLRS
jgi:hypothetical protein